ncbi:hypothetical protein [Sphingobacterium bovistauri]|uniref:Lipoprotein n=1 Tax=Sphingobacterium bovistauri TaxID=2781959 RepID=A0ABS7Z5D6_9SPHI|nr:hypothetical protein [Sphingobacterium bovistauri]MCA5005401.1 hypothetical protein [Sphingobacterium bovistauri]
MKNLTILFVSILFLIACENKESRVFKFTQHVNDKENEIKDEFLIQSKAFYVNKNKINLDLILKSKVNDTIPIEDLPKIEKIVNLLFEKNPQGKDIIVGGTEVNLRLYNAAGVKFSEIPLKDYNLNDLDLIK